jgi:hypothetical protein
MKKVQVRKKGSEAWFDCVIKKGKRLMCFDIDAPGHIEIALIRVEHHAFPQFYLNCPVKHVFRGVRGPATYAVRVPDDEVERLNEEVQEWLAKKEFG